ncbi:MAG: LLM class F420-dependent oxidoreductase [Dehalococcoidia bacterium]|nr:LLM class F420-dependent oxidoreductase [Dehalococcoidia bacterium]
MKIGLQIPYFTWPGGPPELGPRLARTVRAAEDGGFDSIWVMDHFFQIPMVGAAELDMLEAYTTLGFIAAHTSRVTLGAMVTGVTYRHPGILIKQATTLDVLSGGRAWLGIGAAWYEREHDGLGVRFPPLKERFERLEEALQIAHQMWDRDNNGAFQGRHYQLGETLNSPQAISRPRPRILIGGSGEKKTLRLVAKYADACNIFGQIGPEGVKRKLDILRAHCEREGRRYESIEKTILFIFNPGPNGENAGQLLDQLGSFAEAGVQTVIGALMGVESGSPIEAMARDVIPQAARL